MKVAMLQAVVRTALAAVGVALAVTACVPGVRDELPPQERRPPRSDAPPPVFDTLVTSEVPPPPLSGGTLTILQDGQLAVAADPDRDHVFVVDLVTERVIADVSLPAGDEPGRVVEGAGGRIHVALRRGGGVATLDGRNAYALIRRSVCAAPRGLAFEPATGLLHVACAEGVLVSLDEADGTVARTVTLDRDLRDVVSDRGLLYVSRFRAAEILKLDGSGRMVERIAPPRLAPQTSGLGDGKLVERTSSVAWRLMLVGPGKLALVHQAGTQAVIDIEAGGGYGGTGCGSIVSSALSDVIGGTTTELANAPMPIDVATTRDGRSYAVVAAGNAHTPGQPRLIIGQTKELPPGGCRGNAAPFPRPGPSDAAAPRRDGAAVEPDAGLPRPDAGLPTPDGGRLDDLVPEAPESPEVPDFQGTPEGMEPVAVAFDGRDRLIVQSRQPAELFILQGRRRIRLSSVARADTGHAIFHANSGVGLACASCHPEGGDDGRVWNFSQLGPRRTQVLRGGIRDTKPFHWDGDMADLDALMGEVFVKRMSGPTLPADRVAAMGGWLETVPALPTWRPGNDADRASVARGRALFEGPAMGCVACHSGTLMTNNLRMDVGTRGSFQVPSLRGVSWRAPLMHDGCAADLAARFGACGGDDRHGVTSRLDDGQKRDLVLFLQTL